MSGEGKREALFNEGPCVHHGVWLGFYLLVSCKKGNDGEKLWDPEEGKDALALQSQVTDAPASQLWIFK